MENLLDFITARVSITPEEIDLINRHFIIEEVKENTTLLSAGKTERYVYFLSEGIVKGYQNIDGKIVVQHLVSAMEFFTSLESFMDETPSEDYYETITPSRILKISKADFNFLHQNTHFWSSFVESITNEHLNCKMQRVKDFQILTAKERYIKFVQEFPQLALNVSVENIASFLGVEPQSLSRIRKQVAF